MKKALVSPLLRLQKYIAKHRAFFAIFFFVSAVVIINQLNNQDLPGSITYIEVKQLPKIYLADSSKLKVEIFQLNTRNRKNIPRVLPVNFHLFNFHTPTNRWYLTKKDIQELLREHTIVRIVPDTVWFSPWFSTVKKLPVKVDFEVPDPFELIEAHIHPEYIPLLHREANDVQVSHIDLGTIKLGRDKKFQEVVIKAKPYLPEGTVSNVQAIKIFAEVGQWRPAKITVRHHSGGAKLDFVIALEIPVTDSLNDTEKCLKIRKIDNIGFKADIQKDKKCRRIRNVQILSMDEVH